MPAAIGRYQILDRIGQGGMGSLFLALDPMLERQIAIKVLRDDNDELRERFAREARAVARLRHRNIVTIFDVGEQDGHPFIAMEYIQGQTLAELIRGATLHTARKLELIEELCDGLGFAHKAGIVHRDVKPANIMVEHEGAVKILDFGIARIAESGMTQAGMLIGTLNYMSPEQVAGRVVDCRSDIFAVGAVFYEMLAGRQAFPGGLQNGILNRILHEAPPPLRELVPHVDDEIVAVVTRALAKDPDARYQDLAGMRKDVVRLRQRIESETPGPIAPRDGDAETILIQGQETPQSGQRPQGSRRGADRDERARRRTAQIAAQLEVARQAMAAAEFDVAAAAAEQALMLDAEDAAALEIHDRARTALEERQLQQLLTRGEDLLRSGELTDAVAVADEALALTPDSAAARAFRQSIDRTRTERQRALERAEALRAALQRARKLFETGAFEQAEAAAAEALRLDPDLAAARTLQQQARDAAQRAKEIAAALAAAELASSHEAAVKILEGAQRLDPAHAEVGRQLERRQAAWQQEQWQARERREKVAAAIAEAKAATSHAAAIAALEAAQALAPEDKEVGRLRAERRAALAREEEAARRAREREATIAAAMAEADATPDHAAAIGILRRAVAIDAGHAGVREQLAAREGALERQEAELRQARERAGKVAAALAAAEQAASHEAAVKILEGAQQVDPAHAEVGRQLEQRRAAWQEEQRQARERREKVAAAIAEAKAASSHAAAIAALERAQALEPENKDVGRLLAERRTALAKEEEAARRTREREAAIAAALAKAQQTPAHEAAIQILERALTLDSSNAELQRELSERRSARERELEEARLERERKQLERERKEKVAAALKEAEQTASHEAAEKILEGAQQLDPAHTEVGRQLEQRRAAWQEEQRQARERREQVAAAIAQAKATASHAAAIAALEAAQTLEPADKEVGRLLAERRAALAREEEAARRAREREAAMAEADATPDHAAAVGILRRAVAIDEGHAGLREQLAAREHALERQEAERRQAQERATKVAAALAAAERASSHEAAVKILEGALQLDPAHAEVGRQLELRQAAWQEEQRQAQERREKAAAVVAEALTATSHAVAIAALERAQALAPQDREVGRLLAERRAALAREEEAAQRAREREAAVAAALAKARQTPDAEVAIQMLERALALDSSNAEVQRELGERRSARERELEEARLEKERKEKVAAAVKKARQVASDEEAVAILTAALPLEPSHSEMRALLAKRETALQRSRAEAERGQEIASVREKVLHLVSIGEFDAATAALSDAEARLSARKALKDVSRQVARARAAAGERPEDRRTIRPFQAAAAAVIVIALLAAAAYYAVGRSPDDVSTVAGDRAVPTEERPPLSAGQPAVPASEPGQSLSTPAPPPPSPPPAPAEAATADAGGGAATSPDAAGVPATSPDVADATNSQKAATAALSLAQRQVGRGDLRAALATAAGGLRADPQNAALQSLVRDVAARALQQAVGASTSAARLGDSATALNAFRDGQAKMKEAEGHERAGRYPRAAVSLWDATALFARAEREATDARARAAAATPAPAPSQPPASVTAREGGEAGTKPPTVPPPAPAPAPAPAIVPPVSSPPASAAAAPSPPSDEAAVRAALRAYEEAYIALDVAAVKRVFPAVNEAALARSFKDMLAQEVRIEIGPITISGGTAVVTGRVRQSFTPRAGSGRTEVIASVFRLQKVGNTWVIVERR